MRKYKITLNKLDSQPHGHCCLKLNKGEHQGRLPSSARLGLQPVGATATGLRATPKGKNDGETTENQSDSQANGKNEIVKGFFRSR